MKEWKNEYDIKPGYCIRTITQEDGSKEIFEIEMTEEMKIMTNRN